VSESGQVFIAGGGIIGLALAFELTERGRDVCVYEAGRIGQHCAASVAAGMLAPVSEADISHPELSRLALESHGRYADFVRRVETASGEQVGYDTSGTLFVALHRDHRAQLQHLHDFQVDRGFEAEWISRAEIREMEPAISPTASAGLLLRHDHQVDPRRLMHALAAAIRGRGGTIVEDARVLRVQAAGEGYEVHVDAEGQQLGERFAQVVLAGGAWTGQIEAPLPPLPVRPVKGQVLRLRGERLISRVVRTPDVYLVPRDDGELVVGATMEEQGFDARVMAGPVLDLLREAWRCLPGIYDIELAETCAGFRPALRDHMPAIGLAHAPGLFVATGHFRNGIELAPVTAQLLAEQMETSNASPLLEPFAPGRFAEAGELPAGVAPGTEGGGR
jgi:glycine oxidase